MTDPHDSTDFYLVNFDPTLGAEIRSVNFAKRYPNKFSPVTIGLPSVRFDDPLYPTEV